MEPALGVEGLTAESVVRRTNGAGELEFGGRNSVEDGVDRLTPGVTLGGNRGIVLMLAKHGLMRLELVPLGGGDGRTHELEAILGVKDDNA